MKQSRSRTMKSILIPNLELYLLVKLPDVTITHHVFACDTFEI